MHHRSGRRIDTDWFHHGIEHDSVTGTNPGVRELVYTLNGSSLLWDFQAP